MRATAHYIQRAEERTICDAEIREVLRDVREDRRFASAVGALLDAGESVAIHRRGVALVLAADGAEDEPRILTTYRCGKRRRERR